MSDSTTPAEVFPLEEYIPHVPGVPHSFGVGILMILVTMFAVMQSLDAPPAVFANIAVLFFGVALGQMLLFKGRQPRRASMWVGGALFPLELLALEVGLALYRGTAHIQVGDVVWMFILDCVAIPVGIALGYCAGTLTAGIFLFMERRWPQSVEPLPPEIELHPFTAADLATLMQWMLNESLEKRWAGSRFTFPLELPQLQGRLAEADVEPPTRLFLKAVDKPRGQMLAYIELGRIDRKARVATLELAVVDPAEPQRAALGMQLLRAVIERAFGELELEQLFVRVPDDQGPTLSGYRRAGFRKLGHLPAHPDRAEPAAYILDLLAPQSLKWTDGSESIPCKEIEKNFP